MSKDLQDAQSQKGGKLHVEQEAGDNGNRVGGKDGCLLYNGAEAEGFHIAAGTSYIYPTNFPVRQYQATMVKTSLFKNTLVSLPTGLGKTFIAAVVMYNYYRWYPCGKVVFMAPTRPLVAQQIRACHNIMNIPVGDTVEMTGNLNAQQQMTLWKEKRVFFLTPQVMVNDLRTNSCPPSLIKCLVVDEAHRAVKDYAYCQVVRQLLEAGAVFRILALSATPGNDVNAVQQVIKNLNISALELRGEDALDVAPYTHSRSVDSIVVDLSVNIQRVKHDFLQVYEKYYRKLKDYKALTNNISTLSKFQILKACEKFRANPPRGLPPSLVGSLICDFTICMSLAHALELLQTYGLRAFYNYLTAENVDKNKAASTRIRNDEDLKKILDKLGQILQAAPGSGNYIWGHPKYQKLVSIVSDHFNKHKTTGESTRVIIFCEYRVVVSEITDILETLGDHIKPVMFIGQSGGKEKGMPQAKQLQIMKNFRSGEANCLVSTCVGEEGLDVGDVDLIILVETHKSLTRLIQRMGRTGRKRNGRCVILITRGKEEYKFQEAMSSRKSYVTNILNSVVIKSSLCHNNPEMLPPGVKPERELVHIKPALIITPTKALLKKQVDIRTCLATEESPFITPEQYSEIVNGVEAPQLLFNKLPLSSTYLWHQSQDEPMNIEALLKRDNIFSEWIDWNREEHQVYYLEHSHKTNILCSLLNKGRKKLNFQEGGTNFIHHVTQLENDSERNSINGKYSQDGEIYEDDLAIVTKKERIKKNKKEGTKSNNFMDIRLCMANAVDKGKLTKKTNDKIIEINFEDDDSDTLTSAEDIVEYFSSLCNINIKAYLSLPIKSNYFFNDNDEWFNDLDKYMLSGPKSNSSCFEMPLLPDVESLLSTFNDEIISKIKVNSIFDPSLLNNEYEAGFRNQHNFPSQVVIKAEFDHFSENSSDFVGIDELFTETEKVEKTGDDMDRYFNSPGYNVDWDVDNERSFNDLNTRKNNSTRHIREPDNAIKDMPDGMHVELVHTPDKNSLTNIVKNRLWESTPEGLKNLFINTFPKRCSTDNLISSTPINKISDCLGEVRVDSHEEFSQDAWNLSDLWSDESANHSNKSSPNSKTIVTESTGTMVGITQMLSMIEKNKTENVKDENIEEILNRSRVKNCIIPGKKDENDIKLLDIDDDIFVGIDDLLLSSSGSNVSNIEKHSSAASGYKKDVPNTTEKLDERKNEDIDQNEMDNSLEYSQPLSQLRNFKKFNCTKKRVFEKTEESALKIASTSCETRNKEKIGLSLKTRRMVNEIKTVKHVESSYFDFESIDSQMLINEINTDNNSQQSVNKGHRIEIENICSPSVVDSKKPQQNYPTGGVSKSPNKNDEDDDDGVFQKSNVVRSKTKAFSGKERVTKTIGKDDCNFIEKEADVSGLFSSDEDDVDLDEMDSSFIDDRSTLVDIHPQYLQSIKSPVNGKFKIPLSKKYPPISDVLSQTMHQDTEYVNDSFCVNSEEESFEAEPSLLEIAERKLAKKGRGKRRIAVDWRNSSAQDHSFNSSPIVISSDSDHENLDNLSSKRKIVSSSSDREKSSPQVRRSKLAKKKFKKVKILSSSDEGSDDTGDISKNRVTTKSKTNTQSGDKSLEEIIKKQEELSEHYFDRIKNLSFEFDD